MRTLLLLVLVLLVANVAMADHIGIYAEATGSICQLTPGFSNSATIIQMLNIGSTGSMFGISTANAPGSIVFGVTSAYQTVCVTEPCPYMYGSCLTGNVVIGTITALLGSTGHLLIVGVGTDPTPIVFDCNQGTRPAIGGKGWITGRNEECPPGELAVESSTWGSVKALYR